MPVSVGDGRPRRPRERRITGGVCQGVTTGATTFSTAGRGTSDMVSSTAIRRQSPSAAAGFVAFLAGYLAVLVAVRGRAEVLLSRATIRTAVVPPRSFAEVFETAPDPWVVAGWAFYGAHFAPVGTPVPGSTQRELLNVPVTAGWPFVLLLLVPFCALFVAASAAVVVADPDTTYGAVTAGAGTVLGYLPPAVVGAFVFAVGTESGAVAPTLLWAVVAAGVVYPLVVGSLAGVVAGRVAQRVRSLRTGYPTLP